MKNTKFFPVVILILMSGIIIGTFFIGVVTPSPSSSPSAKLQSPSPLPKQLSKPNYNMLISDFNKLKIGLVTSLSIIFYNGDKIVKMTWIIKDSYDI